MFVCIRSILDLIVCVFSSSSSLYYLKDQLELTCTQILCPNASRNCFLQQLHAFHHKSDQNNENATTGSSTA